MPTIYYIRHGETAWNALGRFQGKQDIPLNEIGRSQAVAAGGILRDLLKRDGRSAADLAYVASPLSRARLTMELLRGALDLAPADYAQDERLREIDYGAWEGLTMPQMSASHPAIFEARVIDRWNVAPPEGESYASRTPLVREWIAGLTGDTVAVGHMGTGRALMVALGLSTTAEAIERRIEQGAVYLFSDAGMEIYR